MAQAVGGTLRGTALAAALLLVPAGLLPGGTWLWPQGLAYVAATGGVNLVGALVLAKWRPAHFRVRQQSVIARKEGRQPRIDAVGSVTLLAIGAAWLAFMPIDVFRLRLFPPPPPWLSVAGGVASLVGVALTPLAAWENRFATPNVQHQAGQEIVDTGVYRLVRHPIYLGNLLVAGGTSLWLGSYAALACFGVLLVFTAGRIAVEERDLRRRVPQYADYARQVRARLIPFVI